MAAIEVFAPAKVNLTLHITGQRADGYHLLDSLVSFADVGDVLRIETGTGLGAGQSAGNGAEAFAMTVDGPEAGDVPLGPDNFITQMAARLWTGGPLRFHLTKNLPVAAGIGGGSADAAACFRGLSYLAGGLDAQEPRLRAQLVEQGADVPMCVRSAPVHVGGIGEDLTPVPQMPRWPVLLVNPRVSVPTGPVFKALVKKRNSPMTALPADVSDGPRMLEYLAAQRNDLEPPARAIAPQIGAALAAISATQGCALARMSGSGATCFGLYEQAQEAEAAAAQIRAAHPDWWVCATRLDGAARAAPQLIRATT